MERRTLEGAVFSWLLAILALLVIATSGGSLAAAVDDDDDDDDGVQLVGTWRAKVDTVQGAFSALLTFGAGGTVLVSDSAPPPGQVVTAGHGAWKRRGNRKFELVFERYHFENGALVFTLRISETIHFDRGFDAYEGRATPRFLFPDGTFFDGPPIHTRGTRMKLGGRELEPS